MQAFGLVVKLDSNRFRTDDSIKNLVEMDPTNKHAEPTDGDSFPNERLILVESVFDGDFAVACQEYAIDIKIHCIAANAFKASHADA